MRQRLRRPLLMHGLLAKQVFRVSGNTADCYTKCKTMSKWFLIFNIVRRNIDFFLNISFTIVNISIPVSSSEGDDSD